MCFISGNSTCWANMYTCIFIIERVERYKIDGNCEANNFIYKISLKFFNCETNRKIDWHII